MKVGDLVKWIGRFPIVADESDTKIGIVIEKRGGWASVLFCEDDIQYCQNSNLKVISESR